MVDYQVGDTATFVTSVVGVNAGGWTAPRPFSEGECVTITRVYKTRISVRAPGTYVYNVPREALARPNNEEWEAPPPKPKRRPIGEVPEDGISPDHPGLAWLWEDAERVANSSNYCYQYDHMADKLGIPGRLRDISVTVKVNGLDVTSTVKARSTRQAEEMVREKLGLS